MDAPSRRTNRGLAADLFRTPQQFEFFQAVRLLYSLFPERTPVGEVSSVHREVVRFAAHVSNAFPASQIHDLAFSQSDPSPRMIVSFLGLVGPQGILPAWYTERLIKLLRDEDQAAADFLDIFHHRLVSFFYRSWERHHFPVASEKEQKHPPRTNSTFADYLYDFIGLGTEGLRNRLAVADAVLLQFSGLIAQRPHSAVALQAMLQRYFGVDVAIEQFCGNWYQLGEDTLSYLRNDDNCNRLNFGAVAGEAVWNVQAGFRLRLGPLTYERFQAFLPAARPVERGGKALRELQTLVTFFAGAALCFDIQIVLLADEVPSCRAIDGEGEPLLGFSTWLDRDGINSNADDCILSGRAGA